MEIRMGKAPRALRTDGEITRGNILDAAGQLIAAAGFADTTSKAIAAEAGVDLASINYHFGSRNGLYQAVLIEAHRRLVDLVDIQKATESPLPATEKLRILIEHLVKTGGSAEGWHLTVLSAELLAPSAHIQVLLQSEIPKKMSLIMEILSEITGIPGGDPALLRCLISVVSPCLLLQIGRRAAPSPLQEVLRSPREVVVEHFYQFAIAGLTSIGSNYSSQSGHRSPKLD